MTTENSFSKLAHNTQSLDVKLKNPPNNKVDILKELFKSVSEYNINEVKHILSTNDIADKSLNVTLGRAFSAYDQTNKDAKEIVKILIEHKANPNINLDQYVKGAIKDKRSNTPAFISGLMIAAAENDIQLAEIILSSELINVNIIDHANRNALFYAITCTKSSSEMVALLINAGICVNGVDIDGNSPLTLAINNGDKEIVRILLNKNADVNHKIIKDGNTALHLAVMNNKPDLIYLLLLRKPDLNIKNKNEQTAMEIAATLSRTEVYGILAEEYNQREKNMKKKDETQTTQNESNFSNNSYSNSNEINDDQNCLMEDESNNRNNFHNMNISNKFLPQNSGNNLPNHNKNSNQSGNNQTNTTNPSGLNVPNISININNLPTSNNFNRPGIHFSQKFTKNAKLQKLKYLQDSRQYSEQNGRSIRDKTFKFPSGLNNMTNIEIPFSFQTEKISNANTSSNANNNQGNKFSKGNQLHTFIKIQSTPILHIDISDENKQDQFILSSHIEELKLNGSNQIKRINQLEADLAITLDENMSLKNELSRLKEEVSNKDKLINKMSIDYTTKELDFTHQIEELHNKLKDETTNYLNLFNKFELLEKEYSDLTKECYSKLSTEGIGIKPEKEVTKIEILEKKFSCLKYEEKYIVKCLQRDILDFQEYTKEQIKKVKSTQEELVKYIQDAVADCLPDFEVKLYGSHATNLCLYWSDLDVVLINKKTFNVTSYGYLQTLYVALVDKPWKKSIKLIESAVVPLIKIVCTDQYNNMHIDISLQDSRHYGLKCVELVKSFLKEYEALEPLIFALKNILRNSNLNDPYRGGLSSYGLILMVVSFLQSQQENKKSIRVSDGNLGRMFLEFLWYYGLMFDHSKYVIYAYPTNEALSDKDAINYLYNIQPSHDLIIVDPLSKNNNVARSTFQFINIKMAFMIGFVVSHEECECGCHYKTQGEECSFYNSDHCILKRIFNSVKRFNTNNQGE